MIRTTRKLLMSDDGTTATEYALMLAMIVLAAISAGQTLGCNVREAFEDVVFMGP